MADDACWVVEPVEYVDYGKPLDHGIFDNPERLTAAWDATLATLQAEALERAKDSTNE